MSGATELKTRRIAVAFVVLLASASAAAQDIRDVDLCALPPDRPMRAVHAGGNWGNNRLTVEAWEKDTSEPLVPPDYVAFLQELRVNWVGLSVALHYDDSMDSTVERVYSTDVRIPTFSDRALRQYIREFREHDFEVYLTLAFEAFEAEESQRPVNRGQLGLPAIPDYGPTVRPEDWPWLPHHTDHARFVREFWSTYTDQAVHYARIAQEEGIGMYSLGTETDSLFRSRSGGDFWVNDFGNELRTLAESVRAEYGGLLTYTMLYLATIGDWFDPGSKYLWEDLELDVVGVSGYYPLAEPPLDAVMSVETLQQSYNRIFREHLLPLAAENTGRPIVFTEYGFMDIVEAPTSPGNARQGERFEFSDGNGNGVDDGRETQANIVQALFRTMDRYPGTIHGTFFWDTNIASNELWRSFWADARSYSIRDKPASEVVQRQYACYE